MKVELTLPDGAIPEGSRLEFRHVEKGELYISNVAWLNEGFIRMHANDGQYRLMNNEQRFVVIPPYQWPDCIPEGTWLAMNKDGTWDTFTKDPWIDEDSEEWDCDSGTLFILNINRLNITLPTVTDWRQSKMQKPVKHA